MNELTFFHTQRLQFAARRIARDLQALRAEPTLQKLYAEIDLSLQARLAAVTQARRQLGNWSRAHPNATHQEVRDALRDLNIPATRPALRQAIKKIKESVRRSIRQRVKNLREKPASAPRLD